MRRYRVLKVQDSFWPQVWSWSNFFNSMFTGGWDSVLMNDPLKPERTVAARYPNVEQAKQAIDRHASMPKNLEPLVVYEVRK